MAALLAAAARRTLGGGQHALRGPLGALARSVATSSSAPAAQPEQRGHTADAVGNERVQRLADEIVGLSVLECSWLSEVLRKRLNLERPACGGRPMLGGVPLMGAPGGSGGDEAAAPAAQEKKEKTEFAIMLEAFSAEGKIKVIKEIRAITSLGLKEAKELVEKAPVVIKSGLSKADAEAMQKQLEAAGGSVKLE